METGIYYFDAHIESNARWSDWYGPDTTSWSSYDTWANKDNIATSDNQYATSVVPTANDYNFMFGVGGSAGYYTKPGTTKQTLTIDGVYGNEWSDLGDDPIARLREGVWSWGALTDKVDYSEFASFSFYFHPVDEIPAGSTLANWDGTPTEDLLWGDIEAKVEHKYDASTGTYSVDYFAIRANYKPPKIINDGESWSSVENAFDGSTSTLAATSAPSSSATLNYLQGRGTTAPSGNTSAIASVRVRAYDTSPSATPMSYSFATDEEHTNVLGTFTETSSLVNEWTEWHTLSAPSGGWTWQKVNELYVRMYGTYIDNEMLTAGSTASKVEVEVTYATSTDTNDERDATIKGSLGTSNTRSAVTKGGIAENAQRTAKLKGLENDSDNRSSRLSGYATDLDQRNAVLIGFDTIDSQVSAVLRGADYIVVANDKSGFIAGGDGRHVEHFDDMSNKNPSTTATWSGDGKVGMS